MQNIKDALSRALADIQEAIKKKYDKVEEKKKKTLALLKYR